MSLGGGTIYGSMTAGYHISTKKQLKNSKGKDRGIVIEYRKSHAILEEEKREARLQRVQKRL